MLNSESSICLIVVINPIKMSILLSIVVSCYNKESYIHRCLRSILDQLSLTEKEIEVLVIDDGSTDRSPSILEQIKEKFPSLTLIFKENQGVSSVRNTGIELAKGDYIWFIDGDDYIEENSIRVIKQNLKKRPDMICFNHRINEPSGIKNKMLYDGRTKNSLDLLDTSSIFVWDKIIKKEIIGTIRFNEDIGVLEDALFIIEIIPKAHEIIVIQDYIYIYERTNENSIQSTRNKRHLLKLSNDSITAHYYLKKIILDTQDKNLNNVLTNKLNISCCGHIYSLLRFYNCRILKRTIAEYKRRNLYPFDYTENLKMNLFAFVLNHKSLWILYPLLKRLCNI